MTPPTSTLALARALLRDALAGRTADMGPRLVQLGGPASAPLRDGLTVGRAPAAGLRVRDRAVSREHARVVAAGGGFALEDRSKNGLRVNGRRVSGRVAIEPGDLVEVGPVRLRVVDGDAEPVREATATRVASGRSRTSRGTLLAGVLLLAAAALALAI